MGYNVDTEMDGDALTRHQYWASELLKYEVKVRKDDHDERTIYQAP